MSSGLAEAIARSLKGALPNGQGWMACCPAHDDHTPSLSIRDASGKVLVYCHAGCQQGKVIEALRKRGLWNGASSFVCHRASRRWNPKKRNHNRQDERRTDALAIWQSAVSPAGTRVETYLAARGLSLPIPRSLRFHRRLKHPSGSYWPCMVALVARGSDGSPVAIHRTFLAGDGTRKAPVDPSKMMLGPCRGGAVRLGEPAELLMVGEGIETCLAAMQATGHPAWAALSTSGLKALDLPTIVSEVIVLADGDDPGEAAAHGGATRWKRQGRSVRIARPPNGIDFNDMLGFVSINEEGTS